MLETIKEVLSGYSEQYNLTLECLSVVQIGKSLEIKERVIDHSNGDLVTDFNCAVPLPDLMLDNKTYINIARDYRRVKVVSNGDVIIIGSRFRNEYSIEIRLGERVFDVTHRPKDRNVDEKYNECMYPSKVKYPEKKKPVPLYDPFMIFAYYPGLHSEYFGDDFPVMVEEYRDEVTKVIEEFTFDQGVLNSLSIYSKRKLASDKLTPENLQAILDIIDRRIELNEVPLPSDFKVGTTDNIIKSYLLEDQRNIRARIMKTYSSMMRSNSPNKNKTISMSELKKSLFRIQRDNENGINPYQQDTNTNALSLLSQRDKTYFKTKNPETGKFQSKKLDPKYFVGIIDPSYTADSNLINIKNSLARSAVISNEGFMVKVMTKDFKPVVLNSDEYLMSTILSSDNVDYVNKKLVPNEFGEYSVYQFGDYKYVSLLDEVDYIRYQDSIISEATALLPFANKTIPMRLMLSVHMIADQAVPVVGATPSILYTDVNKEIYEDSKQVLKSPVSGVVKGVGKNYINIDGQAYKVPISEPTANHTTVTYNKEIKEGDIVVEGDVIAESNSFVDKEFAVNVPMFTAFTNFYNYEYEDAVVMSESAAIKFGHLDTKTIQIPIKYSKITVPDIKDPKLDEMNLIKVGEYVASGDTLFAYNQIVTQAGMEFPKLITVKVPEHVQGTVRDVRFKLYESKKVQGVDRDKYLKPEYSGLPQLKNHFKKRMLQDQMREAKAAGVNPVDIAQSYQYSREEPSIQDAYFADIIITIDYVNNLKVSDKLTNQYGRIPVLPVQVRIPKESETLIAV